MNRLKKRRPFDPVPGFVFMICKNTKCVREIPEDAVFCPYCGRKQKSPDRKTKSRGNGLGSVYKLSSGKWAAVKTPCSPISTA